MAEALAVSSLHDKSGIDSVWLAKGRSLRHQMTRMALNNRLSGALRTFRRPLEKLKMGNLLWNGVFGGVPLLVPSSKSTALA